MKIFMATTTTSLLLVVDFAALLFVLGNVLSGLAGPPGHVVVLQSGAALFLRGVVLRPLLM